MPDARRIEPIEIEEEMQRSFLDYAMSVIVARALPDVRDGLKPVHRRILWGAHEEGVRPPNGRRKSAYIVGSVLGKYHPHSDSAVYDAMVRLGQDFASRYPLIDGQGNFGTADGDPAAAMRYTEARLSPLAMELLRDIDKETVDFNPNYDNQTVEPVLLPARFPNLLANGSAGIAVGMATNIPPHNLGEVIDAAVALLDDPELTSEDLLRYVKGPDFPTGAAIMGTAAIRDAYLTGRGSIRVRAKVRIEENRRGGQSIVVTELPYQVSGDRLLVRIGELVKSGRLHGISDVNNESSREGTRLVIDVRRDAVPQVVLNQLYKHTQLQDSFGVIMLALVDGVPRLLNLADVLRHYNAESAEVARGQLMERYSLSEIQATAILDMQLRRLAALERQRIQDEYAELQAKIAEFKAILADPARIRAIVRDEMLDIKRRFADPRRTEIRPDEGELSIEDLIAAEPVVVTVTRTGYVKRVPLTDYRAQGRGGRGVRGANLREDDIVQFLFITNTHHWVLFFTNKGRVYRVKVHELSEAARNSRGTYIANIPGA